VELHPDRAGRLRTRFRGAPVRVVEADLANLWLPRRPFRVIANPPFGAVTALIRRLVALGSRLVRADLVVPGYVAARWTSGDAPASARWQRIFDARTCGTVPARAFRPPPPRAAKVLVIERHR